MTETICLAKIFTNIPNPTHIDESPTDFLNMQTSLSHKPPCTTQQDMNTRGETTHDLLANLFKAYKSVKDCDFTAYIKKKEDEYEEGEDVNVNMLMLQASNKYKTMFVNQTWNAPSPEEEKILALESQIQKLKKQKEKPTQDKKGGKEGKKGKKKGRKERNNLRNLPG